MTLIVRDRREALRSGDSLDTGRDVTPKHRPARTTRQQQATHPMIAIVGFSPGRGTVKRWTQFLERPVHVQHRIDHRQAMEDFTVIEGVELAHVPVLARAGILTFDQLRDLGSDRLDELVERGLDADAASAISAWQGEQDEGGDEVTEIGDIPGVGPAAVKKLAEAGVGSLDELARLTLDQITEIGVRKSAVDAIKAHREKP